MQPAYDAGSPRPFNSPHRVSDANFYARGTALSASELVTGAEIFQTYTFLPDAAGRLPAAFSLSIGMKKRPPFRRAFRQKVGSGRDNAIVIIDAPSSGSILPTPIVVAAVFGRTLQLLFGDAGPVAAKAGIVLEGLPR